MNGQEDPSGNEVGEGKSADQNSQGIIDFNSLQYEALPDLSVATKRQTKIVRFQKDVYNSSQGGRSVVQLNSAGDYLNGRNCFLEFNVWAREASIQSSLYDLQWGASDSAFNFIKNFRILDKSGNELENITGANFLTAMTQRIQCNGDYLTNTGSLWRSTDYEPLSTRFDHGVKINSRKYLLPLKMISGLFNNSQLLPAQLMSGLRIEIEWEKPQNVARMVPPLADEQGNTWTYEAWGLRLRLDSFELTDAIVRQLNIRAATDGLEIQYQTWFASPAVVPISGTNITLRNSRSFSRAFGALIHAQGTNNGLGYNTFATSASNWQNWQWRAGNLYFPHAREDQETALSNNQMARIMLLELACAYGKFTYDENAGMFINRDDYAFDGTLSRGLTHGGMGPIALSLERSTVQDQSGLALNNSRELEFNGAVEEEANLLTMRLFINHMKLVRVFMENSEMED